MVVSYPNGVLEKHYKQDGILQYEFLNILPRRVSHNVYFFSEIVEEIDVLLKDANCILNVENEWIKPSEAMYANSEIHEIVPNHILKNT